MTNKVKLFSGIIINSAVIDIRDALDTLSIEFGAIDYKGGPINFNYTSYYENEMGADLKRYFISFKELRDAGELAGIKRKTIMIEEKFSVKGKRKINIDPGYVEAAKLILASTKNFAHRIYLKDGIYGEVTLIWRGGDFKDLEWSFPDYRSIDYKSHLRKIRELYMKALK